MQAPINIRVTLTLDLKISNIARWYMLWPSWTSSETGRTQQGQCNCLWTDYSVHHWQWKISWQSMTSTMRQWYGLTVDYITLWASVLTQVT